MGKDLICLPTKYLLTILVIFISFASLYLYEQDRKNKEYKNNIQPISNSIDNERNYLNQRDINVLYNDFVAPERREPAYQYPNKYLRNNLNIPTRGIPDDYQLIGVLLRDNTESAYKLFGRQLYPGSTQYEYYAQAVMHNNDVKLPIKIRGDKEIEDNHIVHVPGTDQEKGEFKVKLYNYDAPRYLGMVR